MHERRYWGERPEWIPEKEADSLLAKGDISAAAKILRQYADTGNDPHAFPHTDFKASTLPLYDLAYYPPTAESVQEANDTYGLVADLIVRELDAYNNFSESTREKYRHLGRLSELVVFSLLIREGIENGVAAVPLPASRQDDIYNGIDFYLSPVGTGRIDDGWPIQIKTFLQDEEDREGVTLITLEELDPEHVRTPNDPAALIQCLLRELDATTSDEDHDKLTQATSAVYEKITSSEKMRRPNGRHRRIAKLVRSVFRSPASNHIATEAG